mmetsp:Transcript_120220/g.218494  ORF Transcript_120220/g.218494 Transcript_120220/m.218494 type:complete len:210 (+) Transcript_120220:728-1357(+)
MPFRTSSLCNTSPRRPLRPKLAHWPASTRWTPTSKFWMLATRTSLNSPLRSGPSSMSLLVVTLPDTRVPDTTVPMPGTWNLSPMWTKPPSSFSQLCLVGTWLRNKRTRSRESPETAEVRKIGVTRLPAILRHAVSTSASLRTTNGTFCTPCRFNNIITSSSVLWISFSVLISTLVITTNSGTFKDNTTVRCSLVMPRTPPRLESMTIIA